MQAPRTQRRRRKRGRSIKLGLLSDTHGHLERTEAALEHLRFREVDMLVHAGDIGSPKILEMMDDLRIPQQRIFGNNDVPLIPYTQSHGIEHEPHFFEIEEINFRLTHYPDWETNADILIFGHTHQFYLERHENALFCNPGEVCAREKNLSECAVMEIDREKIVVDYCHRLIDGDKWYEKRYEYANTYGKKKKRGFFG